MKGSKWLQKLNEEELQLFDPRQKEQHYLAGPGTGRIVQEEEYLFSNGVTLTFSLCRDCSEPGAKYSRRNLNAV